jgi:hypothetical protein
MNQTQPDVLEKIAASLHYIGEGVNTQPMGFYKSSVSTLK